MWSSEMRPRRTCDHFHWTHTRPTRGRRRARVNAGTPAAWRESKRARAHDGEGGAVARAGRWARVGESARRRDVAWSVSQVCTAGEKRENNVPHTPLSWNRVARFVGWAVGPQGRRKRVNPFVVAAVKRPVVSRRSCQRPTKRFRLVMSASFVSHNHYITIDALNYLIKSASAGSGLG